MLVLINSTPTKTFNLERGLRQRDPLFPFLFVLVAEMLNGMLCKAPECRLIDGIEVGKDRVGVSQPQFADDTSVLSCKN